MTKRSSKPPEPIRNAILIAGPTASGKSALALDVAQQTGGVIVNADSMQVYDVLDVLTARPDAHARAAAPHELYGHVPPATAYSVASWLDDVLKLSEAGALVTRRPILVGGTGLYMTALTQGLSRIPDIPADIRQKWRLRLSNEGPEALHAELLALDPEAGRALLPSDGQRIVRALEVMEGSGRSLRAWQAERGPALLDAGTAQMFVIEPDREVLAQRIGMRFGQMVESGALDEVRAILALDLDPALPALKAIGVRELAGYLDGKWTLEDAARRATAATRQYAKRQMTWFRNQFGTEWKRIDSDPAAQLRDALFASN